MTEKKTCLVTGGAGFIGSHLTESLLDKGYKVISVDNLITGSKRNISHLENNPNFQFIEHDITKPLPITNYQLPIINYIYHLASPASPPQYQKYSIETMRVNSEGTYNVLELASKKDSKFLLTSTSEIYGDPKEHPQKETYWGNVNPIGKRSCYDESKRFSESLTMEFIRKKDCDARIIRIFNTYGPRMHKDDGRVVSNFINQAIDGRSLTIYGDGKQTRSFCYVTDMVAGLIKAMEGKNTKGEVINLGNPDERSVLEIAHLILKLTASQSIIEFHKKPEDDPLRRKPDITHALNLLNWQPEVGLEEGLNSTIAYFQNI